MASLNNPQYIVKPNIEDVVLFYPEISIKTINKYLIADRIWGIYNKNDLAGISIITRDEDLFCEVSIKIKKEFRKMGFGKKLLSSIASRVNKMNKLLIYVCDINNISSIKLIESIGYTWKLSEKIVYHQGANRKSFSNSNLIV